MRKRRPPYGYLSHATKKGDLARKIAEHDEITEGLVCALSVVEPCRTFSLVWNGRSPYVQSARLLAREHALHGFSKRDVRQGLRLTACPLAPNEDRQPSQVTRLFRRLHAHGLIAKIPRSHRWRVSLAGRRTMSTAIKLREVAYPSLFATAA